MIWSLKNNHLSIMFGSKYALMNTKLLQQKELLTLSHIRKHSKFTGRIQLKDRLSKVRPVSSPIVHNNWARA